MWYAEKPFMQGFIGENLRERDHLEELGVNGGMMCI